MTVLVGGLRALNANVGRAPHGVFFQRPETLSNDFFLNLLDMNTKWQQAARAVQRDDATIVLGLATAGLALFAGAGLMRMMRVGGSEWGTRWFST